MKMINVSCVGMRNVRHFTSSVASAFRSSTTSQSGSSIGNGFEKVERFKLPSTASWSLNDLKILATREKAVLSDKDLNHLSQLAAIDLDAAASKVSRKDILHDINIILNCAEALQSNFPSSSCSSKSVSVHEPMLMSDLRQDESESMGSRRDELMSNSPVTINGFFAVPKRCRDD